MQQIFKDIKEVLIQDCHVEQEIQENSTIEDLSLDSISLLTLITTLENKYEIILDETQFDPQPKTLGDIVQLVQKAIEDK